MDDLIRAAALILPFDGVTPRFVGAPRHCGAGATIIGKSEIGRGVIVGERGVIRADGNAIRLGDDFCLGIGSTVHIAYARLPTIAGDRVAVGADALLHACTIGNDVVVEDGVVVLDGTVVEDQVVIEAGSIVFPRSHLSGGLLYAGMPAKPVRPLRPGELAERAERVHAAALRPAAAVAGEAPAGENFVARTAKLRGDIRLAAGASVFFGCHLDAAGSSIVLGENTNIQDNSVILGGDGVVIGRDTTLGHNVHVDGGRIGDRVLIGSGASIAPGCVVEDAVLLAAGATTTPGQRLETGWMWGGRPAHPIARLDEARLTMMRDTNSRYLGFGKAYRELQQPAAAR